jgi:uncharacterized protein YjbJ (UPF0337 family)
MEDQGRNEHHLPGFGRRAIREVRSCQGTGNEVKGKIKRQMGKDYGNTRLAAEGDMVTRKVQRVAGAVKQAVTDIRSTVKR